MFKQFRSPKFVKNWPHKNAHNAKNTQSGELKIGLASLLNEYLMVTNFRKNPRGSGFFFVEMTWNDPIVLEYHGPSILVVAIGCTIYPCQHH